MDIVTSITILGAISLVVIPSALVLRSYYGAKAALSRKMSAIRASKTVKPAASSTMPEWVPNLLEELGVGAEVLDSDEMPPELAKFMPVIKGFIESGGLERLLGKGQGGEAPPTETWY